MKKNRIFLSIPLFFFICSLIFVSGTGLAQSIPSCPSPISFPVSGEKTSIMFIQQLFMSNFAGVYPVANNINVVFNTALNGCNEDLQSSIKSTVSECRRYCRRQNPSCTSSPSINVNSCQGNILLNCKVGSRPASTCGAGHVISQSFSTWECTIAQEGSLNCECA